jgi:hypothetical protein
MTERASLYLDPDFRRDPDVTNPYCARCQKVIHDVSKAVHVTIDWSNWQVTEGGMELLGRDCWKAINDGVMHKRRT